MTLPRELREELGLEPGDGLVWVKNDEGHWEVWSTVSLAEIFGVQG